MSGSGRHILVLMHQKTRDPSHPNSAVHHLARHWRAMGHQVTFQCGTRRFVPADLVFVHVDLSVVPAPYLALAARYPAGINHRVKDIRKSTISDQLVRRGDDWNGPVIAKSDLNYAGSPERALSVRGTLSRHALGRRATKLWDRFGPGPGPDPFRTWRDYQVYDHLDHIPEHLIGDSRVVIERFLPELEGGLYHLRFYQFLGDRWTCIRMASPNPLVKVNNSVSIERVKPHPIVETWRRRFQLDYGKLDYVIHDGQPILLDVNKTSGGKAFESGPEVEERRRHRAAGIEAFFVT